MPNTQTLNANPKHLDFYFETQQHTDWGYQFERNTGTDGWDLDLYVWRFHWVVSWGRS